VSVTPAALLPAGGRRRWSPAVAGTAGAVAVAVLTGIPTDVIPNPWFMRMTPAPWWALPVFLATVALSGIMVALMRTGASRGTCSRQTGGFAGAGAVAGWLAVGCPVCNKLVVLALGFSGALTWFAPLQPLLAVVALAGLTAGVALQLVALRAVTATWSSQA